MVLCNLYRILCNLGRFSILHYMRKNLLIVLSTVLVYRIVAAYFAAVPLKETETIKGLVYSDPENGTGVVKKLKYVMLEKFTTDTQVEQFYSVSELPAGIYADLGGDYYNHTINLLGPKDEHPKPRAMGGGSLLTRPDEPPVISGSSLIPQRNAIGMYRADNQWVLIIEDGDATNLHYYLLDASPHYLYYREDIDLSLKIPVGSKWTLDSVRTAFQNEKLPVPEPE